MITSFLVTCHCTLLAQTFQNGSLESWGNGSNCVVNTVPDSWISFSNEGIDFDECDFAICSSTIPSQAAEGLTYGRAYAETMTAGEGIAQLVTGFVPGNEYQISFEYAGSNILLGQNDCRWHIFLDNVEVDQTEIFSSTEALWNVHEFTFMASSVTHVIGLRACTANNGGSSGSAAIDNFQLSDITPDVPVFPVAAFTQSEEVICVGECIVFTNSSEFETEVNWTFESGNPASSQNIDEVVVCYNQPGVYTVELVATNEDGTDTLVTEQSVTVISLPTGSLTISGDSLILTTDVGIEDINWTLDGAPLIETGYLITPVESGFYEVSLQNDALCDTTLSLFVEVEEISSEPEIVTEPVENAVWIPNAMTPGDDGINDVWGVYGEFSMVENFTAQVFNRWGQKVYETEDPSARWTGNAFGGFHYVPDGVYLYLVTIEFAGEFEKRQYQGHITVIR